MDKARIENDFFPKQGGFIVRLFADMMMEELS